MSAANAGEVRRAVLVLLALGFLLFLFRLGTRALWDIDEGMHAAMARSMASSGDWVTPVFNGEPFFDKPVLYTWLGGLSLRLLGVSELAARLPSGLCGLATVLVTFLLGRRMSGTSTGLMAGLILCTSMLFIVLARAVVHDVAFTLFVTSALFFFYSAVASERLRARYFLLFYAAAGLAVLTKGPLGLALPAMIVATYLVWSRRIGLLKEMRIGWGALILLAVVGPWYLAMSLSHPEYLSDFLLRQNLGSFLSYEARHPQPAYFYLPVLIGGLLPWSGLVPLALYRAARGRHEAPADGVRFLLVWLVVPLVFFSAAVSKLAPYLLPVFPAVALLLARAWQELVTAPRPALRRAFLWSQLPVAAAAAAIAAVLWRSPQLSLQNRYGVDPNELLGLMLIMAAGLVGAFVLLSTRRYRASLAATVATVVVAVGFFSAVMAPDVDAYRSAKQLAIRADAALAAGEKLAFYRTLKDSALFYTDREAIVLSSPQELIDYLASGPDRLCFAHTGDLEILGGISDRWIVVETVGNTSLIRTARPAENQRRPGRPPGQKPEKRKQRREKTTPASRAAE